MRFENQWTLSFERDHYISEENWDYCPIPKMDESYFSWFTRIAKENASDVTLLIIKLLPRIQKKKMNLDKFEYSSKFKIRLTTSMKDFISFNTLKLLKMNHMNLDLCNINSFLLRMLNSPKYCPYCLKADKVPYFRYQWYLKFVSYCKVHKSILMTHCPVCQSDIKFWKTNWNQKIVECYKCNHDLRDIIYTTKLKFRTKYKFQNELLRIFLLGNNQNVVIHGEVFPSMKLYFRYFWGLILLLTENKYTEESITNEFLLVLLSKYYTFYNSNLEYRLRLRALKTVYKSLRLEDGLFELKAEELRISNIL